MLDKMLDKVSYWGAHHVFKKNAKQIVKDFNEDYLKIKAVNPNTPEMEIMRAIIFNSEDLAEMSENSRDFIEICCVKHLKGYAT